MKGSEDAQPAARTPSRLVSWWRRNWIGVLAVGTPVLVGLCAAGLFPFLLDADVITLKLEPVAQRAVANPASAKLHVSTHSDWELYDLGDYAVQDRMVIFPKKASGFSLIDPSPLGGDKKIPVVVYAADGPDLSTLPDAPTRGWYYYGEWYLYGCTAVPSHHLWWECTLLIGGNI